MKLNQVCLRLWTINRYMMQILKLIAVLALYIVLLFKTKIKMSDSLKYFQRLLHISVVYNIIKKSLLSEKIDCGTRSDARPIQTSTRNNLDFIFFIGCIKTFRQFLGILHLRWIYRVTDQYEAKILSIFTIFSFPPRL